MNRQMSVAQFKLVGNTVSWAVILGLFSLSLPMLFVAFFYTGSVFGGVLGGIGGTVMVTAVCLWGLRNNSRGRVLVSEQGLTVDRVGRRDTYLWDHISAIEPVERSVMFGSNDKMITRIPLLQLRLTHSNRMSLIPFRGGTSVIGIPSFVKTVLIHVDEPKAFLAAADRFMRTANSDIEDSIT